MKKSITDPALALIKTFEGLELGPYICPAGAGTIGFGAIYGMDGRRVTMSHRPITEGEADWLLLRDVQLAYRTVAQLTKVPLSDNQGAVLIDFVYNLGSGQYRASTLRAVINRREYQNAPAQLRRWVFGGGIRLKGLVRRRKAEIRLWNE